MFYRKKQEQGSISLEACIVLPIFIFLLMFFYGFIVFFSGHYLLAHTLIQSAQSLSLDPYAIERLEISWEDMESGKDLVKALYSSAFFEYNEYFSSNEKWYTQGNEELMQETVKNRFLGYLVGDGDVSEVESRANDMLEYMRIQDGISGLDFSETKIENGILTLKIKYTQEFVFNFQGLAAFDRQQTISITLWDVG